VDNIILGLNNNILLLHIGRCIAYVVEFWGVGVEGLLLATRLGFHAIEVNVDSMVVANAINGRKNGCPAHSALVQKIALLFHWIGRL
jgi:hypothetical protein